MHVANYAILRHYHATVKYYGGVPLNDKNFIIFGAIHCIALSLYGIHFILFFLSLGATVVDGSIDSLRTTDNAMATPPFGHSHTSTIGGSRRRRLLYIA